MLIDSHCHLHDRDFFSTEQAEEMLKHAKYNGVEKIIVIGTDPEDSKKAQIFASNHENVYWTFGVHPHEWQKWRDLSENSSTQISPFEPPVAIGEVGLDYHYGSTDRIQQIKLFEQMLQLATNYSLPVSFHVREAFADFLPIVQNFPNLQGVVHSFSDNKKTLNSLLSNTPFYFGVNGMATYSTLPTPPLERILLETDAPFLTPKPFRDIINEPQYIKTIASWLAAKLNLPEEIVKQETTNNATKLFHL